MKTFAAALFASAANAAIMTQMDYDFMRYVSAHNKFYTTSSEFEMRKSNYEAVDAFIQEANARNGTYRAGHNKFSDWTEEEKKGLTGLKSLPNAEEFVYPEVEEEANRPESFDWRDEGKVTDVKDQGGCGSCWAFSTVEVVESMWMIAGNSETLMSPQQLVDCSGAYYNEGCNGGWYFWAYDYLKVNKEMTEASYPYKGVDQTCQYDESDGVTYVSSYGSTSGTSANLNKISSHGPVNVAVSAGNNVFMYYDGGIITTDDGCPDYIDHAIAAVGYGVENGVEYYIVRNSWGTGWGEDGYVRIQTSSGYGVCGINQYVYYANL